MSARFVIALLLLPARGASSSRSRAPAAPGSRPFDPGASDERSTVARQRLAVESD